MNEQEYIKLLEIFHKVADCNCGKDKFGKANLYIDAEGLAQKLHYHAISALYLSRKTKIEDIKILNFMIILQ